MLELAIYVAGILFVAYLLLGFLAGVIMAAAEYEGFGNFLCLFAVLIGVPGALALIGLPQVALAYVAVIAAGAVFCMMFAIVKWHGAIKYNRNHPV